MLSETTKVPKTSAPEAAELGTFAPPTDAMGTSVMSAEVQPLYFICLRVPEDKRSGVVGKLLL